MRTSGPGKTRRQICLRYAGVGLFYALLCVAMWTSPLLRILHVESAALVAGVAFVAAGLTSLDLFRLDRRLRQVLAFQEALLAIPWALLTLTLFWTPNCGYAVGLLLYVLFAGISVLLAVMLAYALSALRIGRRRLLFCLIGLGVVVGGIVYDLGFHPQFYTYNHVFGGVLGPVYDEELAIRPGLFYFRGLSVLWACLCYCVGWQLRERHKGASGIGRRRRGRIATAAVAFLIGLSYLFAAPLGINTPAWYLQKQLGGLYQTPHFALHYTPGSITPGELAYLAEEHEYHYARLATWLGTEVGAPIDSYVYPDADVKARLTGARYTSVAPVWLPSPQVHVLLSSFERVFPHELAHVFSREFGLPVLRASLLVGLVEGFAVASEPPDRLPSPHEQVVVALGEHQEDAALEELNLKASVAAHLSPFGFWTGRGAVSYTTMGSFVQFLLVAYGTDRFKQVYARGDFEQVYGKSAAALVDEWQQFLDRQTVLARATAETVGYRFAIPSLFEKPCPHHVPSYLRTYRQGVAALAVRDTASALRAFRHAVAKRPTFAEALAAWAQVKLAQNEPDSVRGVKDMAGLHPWDPAVALSLGDAYALLERPDSARVYYRKALERLPRYAHEAAGQLILRYAVAGYPGVIHVLVSGAPPEEQARRLQSFRQENPFVSLLAAGRWATAGHYERTAELLERADITLEILSPPDYAAALRRQRLVWLSHALHRSGDAIRAQAVAEQAVKAFRAVGDLDAAAQQEAFVAKMRWFVRERGRAASIRPAGGGAIRTLSVHPPLKGFQRGTSSGGPPPAFPR